jgi:carbonic anhydrase
LFGVAFASALASVLNHYRLCLFARDEQNPYAVVVTCADSRVAPELIFDEGMGFLFVIRSKSSPHTHHCTRTRTR